MVLLKCEGLVCFAECNFPPALKQLTISECDNLQYLFDASTSINTCFLEHLEIARCQSLIWLSSRGDTCNRLQDLQIWGCPVLSSLFLNAKLPLMLKQLDIWECRVLECIAQDFHETTDLEIIKIRGAQNLKYLPLGLDKLSHLQEITLRGCSNLAVCLEEIELSTTNLRVFSISNCKNFGALPKCINNFTSLRELVVWKCSANISFPEEGFSTNLTSLAISGASSLVGWGLHRLTSLQGLQISGEECSDVRMVTVICSGYPNLQCELSIALYMMLQRLKLESNAKKMNVGECTYRVWCVATLSFLTGSLQGDLNFNVDGVAKEETTGCGRVQRIALGSIQLWRCSLRQTGRMYGGSSGDGGNKKIRTIQSMVVVACEVVVGWYDEENQIKDEGVKSWLEDLQDLTYDADDILDEFAYEELRLKLQKTQVQASTSKVRKLLPTSCTGSDFTPSSFLFKNAMIPKMKEITVRLNSLAKRRSSLGLSETLSQAASSREKTGHAATYFCGGWSRGVRW
ncbi:hypothetical protein V6N12_054916 [Hibiscus sabdariffa]|uniref:Disease resistance N-terminal domain-containing protein n=1 Tax=Hibiscus sabdariffa TaxID=183260 RepID=A0ABR2D2P3_9ROSI